MIWLYLGAFVAAIIFLIDFIVRRKSWSKNTKEEQKSLIVSMIATPIYLFFAAFGLFAGIVPVSIGNPLFRTIHNLFLMLGGYLWLIALIIIILSIVLRAIGKARPSTLINYFGIGLMILFLIIMILPETGLF